MQSSAWKSVNYYVAKGVQKTIVSGQHQVTPSSVNNAFENESQTNTVADEGMLLSRSINSGGFEGMDNPMTSGQQQAKPNVNQTKCESNKIMMNVRHYFTPKGGKSDNACTLKSNVTQKSGSLIVLISLSIVNE